MVEGFSGQIELGGRLSPPISALEVRHGGDVYRFNRLLNIWNQKTDIDYPDWTLVMRGPDGTAKFSLRAKPEEMACLGYMNPNGSLMYCLNSKLAHAEIEVTPKRGTPFSYTSPYGGALEFLRPDNPGFPLVI